MVYVHSKDLNLKDLGSNLDLLKQPQCWSSPGPDVCIEWSAEFVKVALAEEIRGDQSCRVAQHKIIEYQLLQAEWISDPDGQLG